MKKLILSLFVCILLAGAASAQDRTITGTVTGADDGMPLPGVTIRVKGAPRGTQSGADGKYVLSVPSNKTTLDFSFIGYIAKSVTIGGSSVLNVSLVSDSKELEAVVITTAAGIKRDPRSVGYSADQVTNQEITNGRQTNVINGLTAKVPGLQIGRSSGGVNTATRITLRGQRSLQGNNQPLFVVDGVPIDNSSVQPSSSSSNQVDVGNRVGDINPDDIESVTVLKGPNAAALYGSQASNGAIIITTKSGKDAASRGKKLEINVNSAVLFENVQKLPELQNEFGSGYENGTGNPSVYDEIENTNWGPRFDGSMVQSGPTLANGHTLMIPYSAVKDNVKDFFNTGINIQNSASFSGGNDRNTFYTSFSDNNVKGVIPGDKFRRNTVKISGTSKLSNLFNIAGNLTYNKNITNTSFQGGSGSSGVYNAVINTSRQIDLKNFKDWKNYEFAAPDGFFDGYYPNPYYALDNNRFNSDLDRLLGSIQVGFDPYKWLNVTYRLGTDVSIDNRHQTFAKTSYTTAYQRPTNTTGSIIENSLYRRIVNSDLIVTLKKDFGKDWTTQLILLQNLRQDNRRDLTASASAISIPGFYNLSNRVGELGGGENSYKARILGLAGDLTVGFRNYLFLNGTVRNDVSSTLPKNNRSYVYPSGNVSFILTEAIDALKDNNILSYAKVRGGVAKVGSTADPYSLASTFSPPTAVNGTTFPYGSLAGFSLSNTAANLNLKPEFTTSYEAGLELGFLKDKLGLDVTYYNTSTTNQIVPVSIAPASGYTAAYVNAGDIGNKGVEIALKGNPVKNSNGFSWNFNVNYTYNKSVVKSLYQQSSEFAIGSGDPVPTAIVGSVWPLLKGTAYLRDPEGHVVVDATTGYIRQDPNLKTFGQINPKHIIGFSNTFTYKAFSLSTTLDYRTGNVIYSGTKNTLTFTGSTTETTQYNREKFIWPNSVIETSPGVYTPNTSVLTRSGNFDFWYSNFNQFAESSIVDAAFLKLRDVSLRYDLPKKLLEKTFLGRASIAATGANILLWTPKSNKYIDPEVNSFGTSNSTGREFAATPSTKIFGFTLSATF